MRMNTKTLIAGAGAAGLVGLGLLVTVPALADPSPETPATVSHGKLRDRHPGLWQRRGLAARGVHGEATVRRGRDGGFQVVTWQRGEVTGKSGAVVTVRSADGVSWQWTTDAKTRVRKDGEKAQLSAVATGDKVIVAGRRTGDTRTAAVLRIPQD